MFTIFAKKHYSMKKTLLLLGCAAVLSQVQGSDIAVLPQERSMQSEEYIKIVLPQTAQKAAVFNMGAAVNPAGKTITFDSQSMLYDGKPVLPVMGEFHYSRFPDDGWREQLLKMKAGGISIVATYIFWIHHEEVEGSYDWSGQRNLRKFVELCGELELPVVLRLGPWSHGEVRNGGIPDWLVHSGIKLRESNHEYMEKVRTWYSAIFAQVQGLMWKDGGAVIGVQLENEYRGKWEHLMELKSMAQSIGFDVPLYTRTGWPALRTPAKFGEIIPLYGDYADGFWDRSTEEMPGDYGRSFLFRSFRNSTVIATEQLPKQADSDNASDLAYPYFTCELGGGMMTSYHRRVSIAPIDVYAMALVRVGSGSNLPGYYMYHGGTNPQGVLTTLNEEQSAPMTYSNDLPVKSYDFQAPLGEFGQVNPHYHMLRRLHLFLQDFGGELALMPPTFPDNAPTSFNADSVLRWCVRSNGNSGYVFVNNYHRLKTLCRKDTRFTIDLPNEKLVFPSKPISIPSGNSFFMPFNMQLGDVKLVYATAQPVLKLTQGDTLTVVFAQPSGIPSEFLLEAKNAKWKANAKIKEQGSKILLENVKAGKDVAIRVRTAQGKQVNIILLNELESLACWKGNLGGSERIFISENDLIFDQNQLYPVGFAKAWQPFNVELKKLKEAGTAREVQMGRSKVAERPAEEDFEQAAVWQIILPKNINPDRDIYLRFPYVGDVARIYLGDQLLTDNFYNGKPFELGLKRFGSDVYKDTLTIKILPLSKGAPIYLPQGAQPNFGAAKSVVDLPRVEVYELRQVTQDVENTNF